jgi:diaminopimelate epimerase
MKFTKMHGLANDYIYVNCFEEHITDPVETARVLSDRHTGIGSDGLIMICPPSGSGVARMEMYNANGSRGEMCGNGLRCVAKYLYDHHLTDDTTFAVETDSGEKEVILTINKKNICTHVEVDMGVPVVDFVDREVEVSGRQLSLTSVNMGNPHCVVFVDDLDACGFETLGPILEKHPFFPGQTNVEFVRIGSPSECWQRTWERGTCETLACGTGASAVCVAGVASKRLDRSVTIHLAGGDLLIQWLEKTNHVIMTGPATEVYSGEISW